MANPSDFVDRQVGGWSERWRRSQTAAVPEMDALAVWLANELPPNPTRPTIGNPAGLLGAKRPPEQRDALTTVTTLPGWLTPTELTERYAERSGRDLATLRFFEVFALFKIVVVIQQLYYRFVNGQTDDPRFANFGDRVTFLAPRATTLI